MSSLSPFQLFLTPHIARVVVSHVANSSRLSFMGTEKSSDSYQALLLPLLQICHNFRAVVLSHFFDDCKLNIIRSDGSVCITRRPLPQSAAWSDHHNLHLVRELRIELDVRSVFTGHSLELLSRASYGDGVFPLACSASFHFYFSQELKNEPVCSPEIIRSNIGAFAEHIRRMAPAVNEIRVDIRHCSEALSQLERQHLGDLLTQLCQIGTRVKHMTRGPAVFDALQAACVRNLVHLDYYSETNCGLLAQLVRQNAATLQYLELVLYQRFDISELVCDDNGDYVQYPHLHTLKHAAWANLGGQTPLPEFEGAIPFPKLRHLFIRSSYPFGDDTPFRNNALTLERLELELDDAAIAMLGKYKVFTPTSHPRLWYVSTKLVPGIVPGCFATMAAYLQLALSIAPSASARRIEDRNFSDMTCPQVLSLFGNQASSINVLSLPKTRLDLWSIIALIKALPLLSDLHTTIPYLGEMPAGSSLATLPAHVISSYAPMGQRFRCWCFSREDEDVSEETAQCVLLLALICPNFDYAALLDGDRWQLMWMLEDAIDTDDFVEHEQRLERLLFSRWN